MVTKRPTTTGGRPMPVLMRLTANFFPGNLESATAVPTEIPINKLMNVAVPETPRDRRVILITSGSKVIRSQKAFFIPSMMSSIMYKTLLLRIFPSLGGRGFTLLDRRFLE
jgi:hypothetical protein